MRSARECAFRGDADHPNAPFDRYLKGESGTPSPAQKAGRTLFMDKGGSACHNGINVGGGVYAPFGVVDKLGAKLLPPTDKGRFMVTKIPSDEYVLKVPTFRNIALTVPYFHSGQTWDLRQEVAVRGASQLGINLSDDGVDKVSACLDSLRASRRRLLTQSFRREAPAPLVQSRNSLQLSRRISAHGIRCAGGGQGDDHESEHGGDSKPHPYDKTVAFH
jgi:cytochrome c peroxidase